MIARLDYFIHSRSSPIYHSIKRLLLADLSATMTPAMAGSPSGAY